MEREKLISLVQALQKGDAQAGGQLYDAFYQDIFFFIRKTVNDPELAADLTQDTFVEILQTIGKLQEPAAFVTWSRQIAYHKCTAHFKKRRELLADEDEDGYSVFDTIAEDREEFIPHEALDKEELKKAVQDMINSLPPEQRSAILLRYFEERSVSQIAQIQGVSEGTVKSRLNYGRKSIAAAVEHYEKKNGVKLRCSGVVPLLLWLLYQQKAASAASSGFAPVLAQGGAQMGAAVAKKVLAKKIVAGVIAAALAGGTAAVLLSKPEPEPEPAAPTQWMGYGECFHSPTDDYRFFLTDVEMDGSEISGQLEISRLYDTRYDVAFTGNGIREGQSVAYTIVFAEPLEAGTIPTVTYTETVLIYDTETGIFSADDEFVVELYPEDPQKVYPVLLENGDWAGVGEDEFYPGFKDAGHDFALHIDSMTACEISGTLTVSYEGQVDHVTAFTGRGYERDGKYHFEVLFDTPRVQKGIQTTTLERIWLHYDPETDTFSFPSRGYYYHVSMPRKG